jgi:hypothetical protein
MAIFMKRSSLQNRVSKFMPKSFMRLAPGVSNMATPLAKSEDFVHNTKLNFFSGPRPSIFIDVCGPGSTGVNDIKHSSLMVEQSKLHHSIEANIFFMHAFPIFGSKSKSQPKEWDKNIRLAMS